jgi:Na+/H+ antiporter NhaD/arsenite permease-like protein
MAVIAVLVFATAYILIATERVPKTVTALTGAAVILGLPPPRRRRSTPPRRRST